LTLEEWSTWAKAFPGRYRPGNDLDQYLRDLRQAVSSPTPPLALLRPADRRPVIGLLNGVTIDLLRVAAAGEPPRDWIGFGLAVVNFGAVLYPPALPWAALLDLVAGFSALRDWQRRRDLDMAIASITESVDLMLRELGEIEEFES
jgi:hypothetical protein